MVSCSGIDHFSGFFYHSYGNIIIFQFNSVGSEIIYILRT